MTGFGAAERAARGLTLRVELRSVNHRHLQIKQRVPAELAHHEPEVEAQLRKKLSRGAVNLFVHLARTGSALAGTVDGDVAHAYVEQLRSLSGRLGIEFDVELKDIISLPGVVTSAERGTLDQSAGDLTRKVVQAALKDLVLMREQEGAALEADLVRSATAIERSFERIAKRMPGVVRRHHAAVRRRAQELIGDALRVSPGDLVRELALLAERLDISEEVTRLEAHTVQLRRQLKKGGVIGRKLDFLAQEFFREANTIGSKCNDARVAHEVVELKTHIDRLREQVQNVE